MSITIENAEELKTRDLLGRILTHLNNDQRIKFFVSRGRGESTVQCLRVMLSRVRNRLDEKNIRRKHFKLHADIFPATMLDEAKTRMDAVILWRGRNQNHEILEGLEALIQNGEPIRLD